MEDGDHPVEEDDGDVREQMDGETGSEGGEEQEAAKWSAYSKTSINRKLAAQRRSYHHISMFVYQWVANKSITQDEIYFARKTAWTCQLKIPPVMYCSLFYQMNTGEV